MGISFTRVKAYLHHRVKCCRVATFPKVYSRATINSPNSSSQISCFPNRSPSLNKVATASALCAEASHMGVLISFQIHHNPAFQELISDSKPTVSLLKLQLELIYHQTVH
ncbi:hypothetical protein TNCV_1705331 [Trichonephila clavipes]|uniref:Uncharacterized protein n=1 Tax=Trichonephila clavipes TaxID=2585209 RepID=A0A8X6R9G3_TRICX|nr:hypothetical protein TNCV_1705331 [Trichonephila clavipes]